MYHKIQNTIIAILGVFLVQAAIADEGYIKHKFINNTPMECYVSVRQQFSYPIQSCLGTVATSATKVCDGAFELQQPVFSFETVCNNTPSSRFELSTTAYVRNTYKTQSVLVTWTIDHDEKNGLNVSYKEEAM